MPDATPKTRRDARESAERKRGFDLLQGCLAPTLAEPLHFILCREYSTSYAKAVRRVVAALRAGDSATLTDEDDGLRAFVRRAVAPPAASSASKRPRRELLRVTADGGSQLLTPPMPEDTSKLALFIPACVDAATCSTWIERTERDYEPAALSVAGGGTVMNKDIRDNDTVVLTDAGFAATLWRKIRDAVPTIDGQRPLGLSDRLRFYRYSGGQSFAKHQDGATVLDGQQSKCTLLLYLSESFEGGATRLCVYDDAEIHRSIEVVPTVGAVFVFDHRLLHASTPVTSGVKYAMRTDVMFSV